MPKQQAIAPGDLIARLKHVAHVGEIFIDGDACEAALRPAARDWTDGDDIDYDFDVGAPIKRTLLRLERVEPFPYCAILWRRRPDDATKAEVLLAGRAGSPYGRGPTPMPPPLRKALVDGKMAVGRIPRSKYKAMLGRLYGHVWMVDFDSLARSGRPNVISVFAPIRNSNDEIVAALELATVGRDG